MHTARDWLIRTLVFVVTFRRADRAAEEAGGGATGGALGETDGGWNRSPSVGTRAHPVTLASGVDVRAHFPVNQHQVEKPARPERERERETYSRTYVTPEKLKALALLPAT